MPKVAEEWEMKCPVCGKNFLIRCEKEEWAYKIKLKHLSKGNKKIPAKYFCSWKCLQKGRVE